jgi:hypothetical protein
MMQYLSNKETVKCPSCQSEDLMLFTAPLGRTVIVCLGCKKEIKFDRAVIYEPKKE